MSFSVPTFNLDVNIWRHSSSVSSPPDVVARGNLAWGRRIAPATGGTGNFGITSMTLLIPMRTDIRQGTLTTSTVGDYVEVPAGTGRYYGVVFVDDIGRGFPNEHRAALLVSAMNLGSVLLYWPTPYP